MIPRRKFIRLLLSGMGAIVGLRNPFGLRLQDALGAEAGRIHIPKGTSRNELINRNPENLDTSELPSPP